MIPEQVRELARQEARRSKASIETVLGLNRVVCRCAKCKGQKSHTLSVVEKHMLLYPPTVTESNGESAPQIVPPHSQSPAQPPRSEPFPIDVDPMPRAITPAVSDISVDLPDNARPGAHGVDIIVDIFEPLIRAPQPSPETVPEACTMILPRPETVIDEYLLDGWLDPPYFRPTSPVSSDYNPAGNSKSSTNP
ncbi:unnamed protein product, partial [Rhizoctonia solani]